MDEFRRALIREKFADLIRDAEAELHRAEKEHAESLAMKPTPDDPEDAAYVAELRSETGAEVYAAKAVCDALLEAEGEVLGEGDTPCAA